MIIVIFIITRMDCIFRCNHQKYMWALTHRCLYFYLIQWYNMAVTDLNVKNGYYIRIIHVYLTNDDDDDHYYCSDLLLLWFPLLFTQLWTSFIRQTFFFNGGETAAKNFPKCCVLLLFIDSFASTNLRHPYLLPNTPLLTVRRNNCATTYEQKILECLDDHHLIVMDKTNKRKKTPQKRRAQGKLPRSKACLCVFFCFFFRSSIHFVSSFFPFVFFTSSLLFAFTCHKNASQ